MKSENGAQPLSRSLRVYQKAAVLFVLVSLLLLLVVLYLTLSRAVITITPVPAMVHTEIPVEVVAENPGLGQVSGYILNETVTRTKTFTVSEEGARKVEGIATGKVTLINDTGASQPLVATTRVLSEEGVLFRLVDAVTVPAHGQIEADVYADEEGEAGDIGPSQFTIPGLSAAMQSSIYAVSVEDMNGGVEYVQVVSDEDLQEAEIALREEMTKEVEETLIDRVAETDFDGHVFLTDVLEKKSDTTPGTETGSFSVSLTMDISGVFYDLSLLESYAESGLYDATEDGFELTAIHTDEMQVEAESVLVEEESATLSLFLEGEAVISSSNEALLPETLSGMKAAELTQSLVEHEGIRSVQVEFTPFWLRRVPRLTDHVEVNIVQE